MDPGKGHGPCRGGEDRLAFVLAHEVAHEVQYHPWANEQMKFLEKRLVEVKEFVTPEGKIDALEQQADQHGLIYAAAAGYDLRVAASVFEDWEPDPRIQEARKRYAAEYFRLISSDAELFAIALRLGQMGRDAEAIEALEGFRERYPGREVFNNLGLFHLRLALGYHSRYAPDDGLSFQRSVVASPRVEIKGLEGPRFRGGAGVAQGGPGAGAPGGPVAGKDPLSVGHPGIRREECPGGGDWRSPGSGEVSLWSLPPPRDDLLDHHLGLSVPGHCLRLQRGPGGLLVDL